MLELLLPQRCVACGRSGVQLCDRCHRALPRLRPPWCERCGAPTAWPVRRCAECTGRRLAFVYARAAVAYDDRVRALVASWKERGLRRFARVAAELVVEQVLRPETGTITFVPPVRDRWLKRGHHPAERLAHELGDIWQLPALPLLRGPDAAPHQRGASLVERRRNVRGAFVGGEASGRVCLVDDVYTSGATANAAASALRKAGARRVEVVTFARALRLR